MPETTGTIPLRHAGAAVYRIYDLTGALLYVGVTGELCRRIGQHLSRADWIGAASRVDWEIFPSRQAAEAEERRLIRRLKPPHNVIGRRAGKGRGTLETAIEAHLRSVSGGS